MQQAQDKGSIRSQLARLSQPERTDTEISLECVIKAAGLIEEMKENTLKP
jgi:hypothetical protein